MGEHVRDKRDGTKQPMSELNIAEETRARIRAANIVVANVVVNNLLFLFDMKQYPLVL